MENASFMPWLVGTALIHSLAVTEKRGGFKSWTVLLAILAFSLSLLGTFIVRSGVLTSVHSFASDPARGLFILIFLGVVVGGSLLLYAWRAPRMGLGGSFELMSRETLLLSNNVLFVVAAASVLLGTLYPLILDALGMSKISVGPPYFNAIFIPLMTPMVFLMGVAPLARWKKASLPELAVRLRWAFGVSVVTALLLPVVLGTWSILISLGFFMAGWIILSLATNLWSRVGGHGWGAALVALKALPRGFYGMTCAHLGVAVFALGVTLSGGYSEERELLMAPGDSVEVGGYQFRFDGVVDVVGPNYKAKEGTVSVSRNGKEVVTLHPQKRVYRVQRDATTEAGIDPGLFRDLFVALGEPVSDGAWSMRLYYKPFVQWIWLGPLFMVLGGLLAASDRRYRLAVRHTQTTVAAAGDAVPVPALITAPQSPPG